MLLLLLVGAVFLFRSDFVISISVSEFSESELAQLKSDAAQQLAHGHEENARRLLKPYLENRPEDHEAYLLMAKSFLTQNRYEDCYIQLEKCLLIKPQQEESQFTAGVVAEQINKTEQAVAHFQAATGMAPDNVKYAVYLGNALLRAGRADEAMSQSQVAMRLDPTLAEVHALRAKISEYHGHWQEALDYNTRALELLQDDRGKLADYAAYHGQLLRKAGRPRDAVTYLFAIEPSLQRQERVVEQLSEAYKALGEPVKAAGAWIELFTLEPTHVRAAAEAAHAMLLAGHVREARYYCSLAERINPDYAKVREVKALLDGADSPPAKR